MLLEERGGLKLTDPVKVYLPDAPAAWDSVTLFNLLTQTSGIHDYTDTPDFGAMMTRQMTPEQLIDTFRDRPLDFVSGEKFSYSNSNYILLGSVIEKVSGLPYAKFIQDNLFTPLGMKDSGYDSGALIPRRASGYRSDAIHNAPYMNMGIAYAAGALYSTTHDLLTWEKALLGGKVISPDSLKKMTTPFKGRYGMGLYIGTVDGHREISHTGGLPGYTASMAAYPDDGLFAVGLQSFPCFPGIPESAFLPEISFCYVFKRACLSWTYPFDLKLSASRHAARQPLPAKLPETAGRRSLQDWRGCGRLGVRAGYRRNYLS
jgi:CubicO group peptidase (beta-lactamase class C family)